jgi:hypothetical protein
MFINESKNHHHLGYFVDLQAKTLLQSTSLLYDHFLLNHQYQQDVIDVLHLPETIISTLVGFGRACAPERCAHQSF